MRTFDAIVIGAGQAGPFLAVRLAEAGRKVALIERGTVGGTCVNNGCIPTKTMIASARAAHVARQGARFGVDTGPVRVDYGVVKARKDALVREHVEGLTDWLGTTDGVTMIAGEAAFAGSRTVVAGGERFTAPLIFLNTGGRPAIPDWPGLDGVPYLTNVTMMDLEVLPEHLVIVGGSYVGLEFAQMFRRFGSEVTVLEHGPRLVSREDADVSDAIADILAGEGIEVIVNARDFNVSPGITVGFTVAGVERTVSGSHLLVAVGRRPNTDALNLEAAGIATDARGHIEVDDRLETTAAGIYALGDITGHGAFTHTSYNDFTIVVANLLDGESRKVSDRIGAYNLYIDPPLGRVGMSEAEVRKSGRRALKGILAMSRVGRARERDETQGFMKVLVDADDHQILGAAILGIEADEVVQTLLPYMATRSPYTLLERTMFVHPTVSELLPTAFGALVPLD